MCYIAVKNDEWRNNTFLYKNITLSNLFLEEFETGVGETETRRWRHTEDLKDLDTWALLYWPITS